MGPAKKTSCQGIDNIDTLPLDTQSAEDVSLYLSMLPDKGCPAETGERQYFCKPMGSSDSLSTMLDDKTVKTPEQIKEEVTWLIYFMNLFPNKPLL